MSVIQQRSLMTLFVICQLMRPVAQAVDASDRIEGRWLTQDKAGIVSIYRLDSG